MIFSMSDPIWLHPQPVDFRKQLDGLIILVADALEKNPASGQLFLFRDRTGKKIKILWWDRNGFWLFYKRLEKGKFIFPRSNEASLSITRDQFFWLLSGLDYLKHSMFPEINPTNFF